MSPKVLIYSKHSCPYCVRAKEFFKQNNIAFQEIDLTDNFSELDKLKKKTGHMTVPQIFVDDVFIGGYSDMIEKYEKGKLKFK